MTTVKQGIVEVLQGAGRPMHVTEITERVLAIASNLEGKTPQNTVNAVTSTDSRFKRVSRGVYALSEWHGYTEFRKVTDIVYDILLGASCPLSLAEMTSRVLSERRSRRQPEVHGPGAPAKRLTIRRAVA